ncbi:MAG: hypothetical protein ACM3QW_08545 [Ignavibacteriales bacterium]
MQLNNGERAILAYFHHSNNAQQAMRDLKQAGFSDVQMDRITKPPITHEDTHGFRNMSLYEFADELTAKDLGDPAAAPSKSLNLHDEHDYVVTLVVNQPSVSNALSIVRKYADIVN